VDVASEEQVVDDIHVGEELDVLKGPGYPQSGDLMGLQSRKVFPLEQDFPFGRAVNPAQAVEKGGLSGTIGADYGMKLSLLHVHVDSLERNDAAEMKGQTIDLQKSHERFGSYDNQRFRRL
jgi:hypothetical protein